MCAFNGDNIFVQPALFKYAINTGPLHMLCTRRCCYDLPFKVVINWNWQAGDKCRAEQSSVNFRGFVWATQVMTAKWKMILPTEMQFHGKSYKPGCFAHRAPNSQAQRNSLILHQLYLSRTENTYAFSCWLYYRREKLLLFSGWLYYSREKPFT